MISIFINDRIDELDLQQALQQLSEQRLQQALAFKHPRGQRLCAAAYLLLCQGLEQCYGISEKPLFEYAGHGKPSIIGHPDIHFNLSHCSQAAICAIADTPVGADIEVVRPYKPSLAEYVMNASEMHAINKAPRPDVMFTQLWTMKEATLKLSGMGINNHMKDVLSEHKPQIITAYGTHQRYVYSIAY